MSWKITKRSVTPLFKWYQYKNIIEWVVLLVKSALPISFYWGRNIKQLKGQLDKLRKETLIKDY